MPNMNYDIKDIYQWPFKIQAVLLLLMCLMLFYIVYLLDIKMLQKQIVPNAKQEEKLKNDLANLIIKKEQIRNHLDDMPTLKTTLLEWQNKFIAKRDVTKLQEKILKLASDGGLTVDLFEPSTKLLQQNSYTVMPLKIIVQGEFAAIGGFMSQLINIENIVKIGDFMIASMEVANVAREQTDEVKTAKYKAEINLEIYQQ